KAEFQHSQRYKRTISLLLFDLDHFKNVNDQHGHRAGDAVLRTMAEAVAKAMRGGDVFARIGGEEFACILRETDHTRALRGGARARLKDLPFASLADATIDTHRALRQGMPESVFAEGKTIEQVVDIARALHAAHGAVLCTRVRDEQAVALARALPEGAHDPVSRTYRVGSVDASTRRGAIAIVTAGTSYRPVAAP